MKRFLLIINRMRIICFLSSSVQYFVTVQAHLKYEVFAYTLREKPGFDGVKQIEHIEIAMYIVICTHPLRGVHI